MSAQHVDEWDDLDRDPDAEAWATGQAELTDEERYLVTRWDSRTYTPDQLADLPAPEWLVEGLLVTDSLAMLYGPSGQRKTFVAIDVACAVASGRPWHGRKVMQGPVVYVAAEGVRGLGQRFTAWQLHHRPEDALDVAVVASAVNLAEPGTAAMFAAWVKARKPALIIFDTLARCTVGAEENSAKDMGQVVDHLGKIREQTGACVLVIHHTGKDPAKGGRGSTAVKGALDTEIVVTSAGETVTVKVPKNKDAPEPLPFFLEATEAHGSVVLTESAFMGTSAGAERTLEVLREIDAPGGTTMAVWLEAADTSRATLYRHRTELLRAGSIVNVGTDKTPRYRVSDED